MSYGPSDQDKRLWALYIKNMRSLTQSGQSLVDRQQKASLRLHSAQHVRRCLDLHGKTHEQSYQAIKVFLKNCQRTGYLRVLLITGKGSHNPEKYTQTLRYQVPRWLGTAVFESIVRRVSIADQKDGGEGALYVDLFRLEK